MGGIQKEKGQIKGKVRAMESLGRKQECPVLDSIWIPTKVPHKKPGELEFPNNKSYEKYKDFALNQVLTHLGTGGFMKVDKSFVKVSNPIIVEDSGRKLRKCMDARYINSGMAPVEFTLLSLHKDIHRILKKDDWMCV